MNNNITIAEPKHNYWKTVFECTLCLLFFLFLIYNAILEVLWFLPVISLIFVFLIAHSVLKEYKKNYIFYPDSIIVQTPSQQYITQIKASEITAWNEYTTHRKNKTTTFLIIESLSQTLVIEKEDYKNYFSFVDHLKQLNLPTNKSLTTADSKVYRKELHTPFEKNVILTFAVSCFVILASYWLIIRTKSDSDETMFFIGQITSIHFSKRTADLKLEEYQNLIFHTRDKAFFKSYNYNNGNETLVNKGKTIKISILKSDYDWLMNDKFIQHIRLFSTTTFNITNYTILD
ncbi:hypothetical protein [Emticicia sp. 17c]|uniref:hypothetical protein n=1 Tax=Emticicia sp. 17c TaxID=3127704 RepID=UPI00301E1A1C